MSADDPTEREKREAEALRKSLDAAQGGDDVPDDALQAAALLRYSQDGGELSQARQDAMVDELWSNRRLPRAAKGRAPWRRLWAPWTLATSAGLAVVAVTLTLSWQSSRAPSLTVPPGWKPPAPTASLLSAQSQWASGEARDPRPLRREMAAYRRKMLASLGRPGESSR